MSNLNLIKLDSDIKTIKYPLIFILLILTYKNNFDDYTLSYMLRLFFKYNEINYNIEILFNNELNNHPMSLNIVNKYYNLNKKKILLYNLITKWQNIYNNDIYNNLNLQEQICYIKDKHTYFKSIFGCTSSAPFYYNLHILLNNEYKYEMMLDIESRLLLVVNLLNPAIFKWTNIKMILVSDFYNMEVNDIIKYLTDVYNKINELFINLCSYLIKFEEIIYELYNLTNPFLYNIIDSEFDSDIID
jgi:hypothetical protein